MAHDDLRARITELEQKGVQEAEIRSKLKQEGWSDQDITGAFAAQHLVNSPIGRMAKIDPDSFKLKPQHSVGIAHTLFQLGIIAVVILLAPGAYGFMLGVVSPILKGKPAAPSEVVQQYAVVGDIPADEKNLITSRPKTQSGASGAPASQTQNQATAQPQNQPTNPIAAITQTVANIVNQPTAPATTPVIPTPTPTNTPVSPSGTTGTPDTTPPAPVPADPTPTPPVVISTTTQATTTPATTPSTTPATPPTSGATVSTPAQLTNALASAKPGDVITLAGGNYGDVTISSAKYSSPVTIQSADASNPATFRTLNIKGSNNLTVNDVYVHFTPDMSTVDWASTVFIYNSTNITFENSTIKGEPAVNGGSPDATTDDPTGNVVGFPTAYGISMPSSSHVSILNNDISGIDRGIIITGDYETIRGNNIHNNRRTPIAGGGSNLVIDNNYLHDINPWKLGSTPYGDHADYLALWTDSTHPDTNIQITNNRMEIGAGGSPVLGMWFEGTSDTVGFSNAVIRNNVFIINNLQAIVLSYTTDTVIDHNVMLRTPGDVGPNDYKSSPQIVLEPSTLRMQVTNNITYQFSIKEKDPPNNFIAVTDAVSTTDPTITAHNITYSGNIYAQQEYPTKPWYYDQTIVQQAESMSDASAIYDYVKGALKNPGGLVLNNSKNHGLLAAVWNAIQSISTAVANARL